MTGAAAASASQQDLRSPDARDAAAGRGRSRQKAQSTEPVSITPAADEQQKRRLGGSGTSGA
jgi:hypothetical protein